MSSVPPNPVDMTALATTPVQKPTAPPSAVVVSASTSAIGASASSRQLADLPREELEHLAEEYGLEGSDYKTPQHLIAAIHERRQLIASMDREAMLDVIRWGRRPVSINASSELLAQQIAKIKVMRFHGLSQRGLQILAQMRGLAIEPNDDIPRLVKKLKRQEGLFKKLNRKRRAMIGGWVGSMIGENVKQDYQFLPPADAGKSAAGESQRGGTIKEEIEESGLLGGLTNRIKKSADSYVNQKLDEIEARIDRKLDEIDRRLAEWRDKEIANRLRILKITLWASVIVGAFSLIYSYIKVYFATP